MGNIPIGVEPKVVNLGGISRLGFALDVLAGRMTPTNESIDVSE